MKSKHNHFGYTLALPFISQITAASSQPCVMDNTLSALISRLEDSQITGANVIPWSCPIPSFGDVTSAKVATLGLNPSNKEFVDHTGTELDGPLRRFHTLTSLGLARWSDAAVQHKRLIWDACREYFIRNPYDIWFRQLDHLIKGIGASYYAMSAQACHLDLIPYATACKWTDLTQHQRSILLNSTGNTLGILLHDSPVKLLILNGKSVVDNFEAISGTPLEEQAMPDWELPRQSRSGGVQGFAYKGIIRSYAGIRLKHKILVLGFNHNIQSSFGVTRYIRNSIRDWIVRTTKGIFS